MEGVEVPEILVTEVAADGEVEVVRVAEEEGTMVMTKVVMGNFTIVRVISIWYFVFNFKL